MKRIKKQQKMAFLPFLKAQNSARPSRSAAQPTRATQQHSPDPRSPDPDRPDPVDICPRPPRGTSPFDRVGADAIS